jgi:hypothetical protein
VSLNRAAGGERVDCPRCGAALEIQKTAAVVVEAGQSPPVRQPAARPQPVTVPDEADPNHEPELKESSSDAAETEFHAPRSRAALWFFLGLCVGAFPSLTVLLYVVLTMPKPESPVSAPSRAHSPVLSGQATGNLGQRPVAETAAQPERVDIERIPASHQFIPPGLKKASPSPAERSTAAGGQKKEEEYETGSRPLRHVSVEEGKSDDDVQIPRRKDGKQPDKN